MAAKFPATFNELAHHFRAVKNKYCSKVFDAHTQTNADFAHLHIVVAPGFVIPHDPKPTAETGIEFIVTSVVVLVGSQRESQIERSAQRPCV
jgi:hypothetical protein